MLGMLSMAWGFAFYLIEVGLQSMPPLSVVNIRLIVGASTLYAVMHWQGYSLPMAWEWWVRFALLATIGNLIPFSLIWFLILAAIRIGQDEDWNVLAVIAIGLAGGILAMGLLMGAIRNARLNRAESDVLEYG